MVGTRHEPGHQGFYVLGSRDRLCCGDLCFEEMKSRKGDQERVSARLLELPKTRVPQPHICSHTV